MGPAGGGLDGRDADGGEAVVGALADPDLGDPLRVDGGLGGVEVVLVEHAVERRREEDEGVALDGLDFDAELGEGGLAAVRDVVEVNEDRRDALAAVLREAAAVGRARVEGVVVRLVELAAAVPADLRQLEVLERLARERANL